MPGFLPVLLQVVGMDGEVPIKQAASIFFKNRVMKNWEYTENDKVTEQDKEFIKSHILQVLVQSPNNIRAQVSTALGYIIRFEFPKRWSTLIATTKTLLQTNDLHALLGGLTVCHKIIAGKGIDSVEFFESIIKELFPCLLSIADSVISMESEEAFSILKSILKSFLAMIQYQMPNYIQQPDVFSHWTRISFQTLEKKEPEHVKSLDADEREVHIFWKMKKWAYHCLARTFLRYGNVLRIPSDITDFSNFFFTKYAQPILNLFLKQSLAYAENNQTNFISERIICIHADVYCSAVKSKSLWPLIKQHAEVLLTRLIFPALCFTEEDHELWEDDPVEYIRLRLDPYSDYYTKSFAMASFLIEMVKSRKKVVLGLVLGFVNGILNQYNSNPSNMEYARQKDGALYMVGSISEVLSNKDMNADMLQFMLTHVFPELQGNCPFLQARACKMIEEFSELSYRNQEQPTEAMKAVYNCLNSNHLPVKVAAASALAVLMDYEGVQQLLIPLLPNVMQILLNLTNESEIDTLSYVLEKLVQTFSEQMAPFALQLTLQLRDTFHKLGVEVYQDKESNEFNEEKIMTAVGLVKTISTLCDSVSGNEELMVNLMEQVAPIAEFTFSRNWLDVYEEVFEMIETITFKTKKITPSMWKLYEPLCTQVFKSVGIDYLAEFSTCMDNFVSYGSEVWISEPRLQQLLLVIIQQLMTEDRWSESDRQHGCKIIESILLCCRGKIDQYLGPFLDLVIPNLSKCKQDSSLVIHLEVVINGIFYNPGLALQHLESKGCVSAFFGTLFEKISLFNRVHDIKLVLLACNEILGLPLSSLPESVKSALPHFASVLISRLQYLPKAMTERQKQIEEIEAESEAEEEIHEEIDEEADYEQAIQPSSQFYEDDSDEGEWLLDTLEEELFFETMLDSIDVVQVLNSSFQDKQTKQHDTFGLMISSLNQDQQYALSNALSLQVSSVTKPL